MLDVTLGIAAAIGSSIFYSLGIAFQATDAKQAPREQYLRAALLIGLLRRARWVMGTGLTVLGWPLQVLALSLAPLVVVQPALATGLLVLLVVAERMLGEHAGRTEHLAMGAIVVGVVCVALCAPPVSHTHTSEQGTITIVLVVLGAREPDPLRAAHDRAPADGADDALRRARVRVERDRDQAGL